MVIFLTSIPFCRIPLFETKVVQIFTPKKLEVVSVVVVVAVVVVGLLVDFLQATNELATSRKIIIFFM